MSESFWSRLRSARLFQVLIIYLAASWVILQVVSNLRETLELPRWVSPVAFILLVIGLVIVLATAWAQSHPLTGERAAAREVPGSWELELGEIAGSLKRGELPHLTWARAILGGIFAFSLLFGFAGLYVLVKDRGRSLAPAEALAESAAPGIAVLPFAVRGDELDVWREGMVDLLSTALDGAAGLRAIDSRTVLARWRERLPEGGDADLATALGVAAATGARHALLGSAVAIGPQVRLTADIYEIQTRKSIGQVQVEGVPDSVLALVDRLAMGVLRHVVARSQGELPHIDLASVTTTSIPALKAYLEGEVLFRRALMEPAIEAYQRAVEADSTFALAYRRLSQTYGWSESVRSQAGLDAIERAARLIAKLPPREALLVRGDLALHRATLDGVEPLREAVRRYPDDAEAWFGLGDTYFHLGRDALVDIEEIPGFFERAVALDPRFAPYYLHLIDHAMNVRLDSARAARWLDEYTRLAPNSRYVREYRQALGVAFGNPETKRELLAALDTLNVPDLRRLHGRLFHPRRADSMERVLDELRERADRPLKEHATHHMAHLSARTRGHLAAALRTIDDPLASADVRPCMLVDLSLTGLPLPEARLERERAAAPLANRSDAALACIGAYAATRGRVALYDSVRTELRGRDAEALARNDSVSNRRLRAQEAALDGFAHWRRGDRAAALERFQAAQQDGIHDTDPLSPPNGVAVRWALAELYLELGRPRDAESYFRSFWIMDPLAQYRLGQVYEKLGENEKAREAYRFFLDAWTDADAELKPLVEDAARALARISGERASSR
ncbi:MAG: tetratricopeptide repeat protein [Gemmatimonadetes bacterium]|nr:tetratricopeptide repeat protein [Gemmatimonadota bacterium]